MTAPVELVGYDRRALGVGIVHLGVGNFHRSHQAMYLDRLARLGLADGWGICGVGVLAGDSVRLEALAAQGCEYTLVEQEPAGARRAIRIGSIVECLHAPSQLERVLERLADPRTRVVSLTITEGGYNISDATGEFDTAEPVMQADAAPGARPQTAFGLLIAGIVRRRAAGVEPFTILSCDNVEANGEVARQSVTAFAQMVDPELAGWIGANVSFASSMVDRITPASTDAVRELVRGEFGIEDAAPVLAESFAQWVIEDDFPAGRPAWERVGAECVLDVRPHELLKLRLLNGSHQAMAYPGLMAGLTYAHEATTDPVIAAGLAGYMGEAALTLEPIAGVDPEAYQRELVQRFSSPYMPDTLARLAVDGSDRIPKFVVPVIGALRAAGRPSPRSAEVLADWARYLELATAQASTLAYSDRQDEAVRAAVARLKAHPADFLEEPRWFGELAGDALLRAEFSDAYSRYRASAAS